MSFAQLYCIIISFYIEFIATMVYPNCEKEKYL